MITIVILSCPSCGSTEMIQNGSKITCKDCRAVFAMIRKAESAPKQENREPDFPLDQQHDDFDRSPAVSAGYGRHARPQQSQGVQHLNKDEKRASESELDDDFFRSYKMNNNGRIDRSGNTGRYNGAGQNRQYSSAGREREPDFRREQPSRRMTPEKTVYDMSDKYKEKMIRAALLCFLAALLITLVLGVVTDFKFIGLVIVIGLCAGGMAFLLWLLIYHTKRR